MSHEIAPLAWSPLGAQHTASSPAHLLHGIATPILQATEWTGQWTVFPDVIATMMRADVSPNSFCGAAGTSGNACGIAASTIVVKIPRMTGDSSGRMGEATSDSAASLVAAGRVARAGRLSLPALRHLPCLHLETEAGALAPSRRAPGFPEAGTVTMRRLRTRCATAPTHG